MSAIVRGSERVSTPSRVDLLLGTLSVRELIGFGWDPDSQVFAPDPAHPLLGYLVCRVEGCGAEACEATGVCTGCLFRWKAARGVDLAVFCAAGTRRAYRCQPGLCAVCCVPGFERPATANGLCFICDHQRRRHDQTTAGYVNGDETFAPAEPRVTLGVCTVALRRAHRHGCAGRTTSPGGQPTVVIWCCSARPRFRVSATVVDGSCSPASTRH